MNNAAFSNSYIFNMYRFEKYHYSDQRSGVGYHFIARMRKGSCRLVSADKEVKIQEGDIFYIPKGCCYQSFWYGNEEKEILFDSFGFHYFPNVEDKNYTLQKLPYSPHLNDLASAIADNKHNGSIPIYQLFALLGESTPHMEFEATSTDHALMYAAEQFLRNNPHRDNRELAHFLGLSESGMYAFFRRSGSLSPNILRQKALVANAENLLTTTDLSIEQISNMLNFSSTSYFRKIIRKYTGKTPSQIRSTSSF